MYSFEKLKVWKEVAWLSKDIYKLTDKYPGTEKFGLINQLRRATNSISANLILCKLRLILVITK